MPKQAELYDKLVPPSVQGKIDMAKRSDAEIVIDAKKNMTLRLDFVDHSSWIAEISNDCESCVVQIY